MGIQLLYSIYTQLAGYPDGCGSYSNFSMWPSVKWIILSFVYKQNDSSLLFTTKVGFQKQMAVLIGLCKMGLNQSWNLIIYWPLQNQLNIKICLKSSQVLAYKLLIETSRLCNMYAGKDKITEENNKARMLKSLFHDVIKKLFLVFKNEK